jgi:hypothetical protein
MSLVASVPVLARSSTAFPTSEMAAIPHDGTRRIRTDTHTYAS